INLRHSRNRGYDPVVLSGDQARDKAAHTARHSSNCGALLLADERTDGRGYPCGARDHQCFAFPRPPSAAAPDNNSAFHPFTSVQKFPDKGCTARAIIRPCSLRENKKCARSTTRVWSISCFVLKVFIARILIPARCSFAS